MKVRSTNARAASILAVALGFAGQAAAQEQPKALDCVFEVGNNVAYAGGEYKASPAHRLTFRIEAIDLDGQRAELHTEKGGKGEVKIVRAVNANHFLEVVNEGFLNMTTVYDYDADRKAHPAVHSRHLACWANRSSRSITASARRSRLGWSEAMKCQDLVVVHDARSARPVAPEGELHWPC